jgi:ABC-type transporter Mla subunit MlaD
MLIALLLSQLLGVVGLAGPSAGKNQEEAILDLRTRVEAAVTASPARNERATKSVEAMGREMREFDRRFNNLSKKLSGLAARHDARKDEILRTINQLDKYGDEATDTMIKQRSQLKKSLTRREWNAVFHSAGT